MAVYVDLSFESLNPNSVARLVKEHVTNQPSEDMLVKVSRRAYHLVCGAHPSGAVKVSRQELRELNAFLKRSLSAKAFTMRRRVKCSKCGRVLTFYDLFRSGRARHGDEHVASWFSGKGYHVHIQKRGRKLPIKCTSCGTINVLATAGYDGPEY